MQKKEDEMKERHERMRMSVNKKYLDDAYPDRKTLPMTLHKQVNGGKGGP